MPSWELLDFIRVRKPSIEPRFIGGADMSISSLNLLSFPRLDALGVVGRLVRFLGVKGDISSGGTLSFGFAMAVTIDGYSSCAVSDNAGLFGLDE
jgi:hypothetical protein